MGELEGRVAVVTGAGRGIGAAVAMALAGEGAHVVVNDLGTSLDGTGLDTTPAEDVANKIVESGGAAVPNPADVADFDAAGSLIQSAIDVFGRLDVLVNVAGILRDRMIFNMDPDDWDAVIRVHLRGTFNTTRHASAYWRRQRDESAQNRIINFASDTGIFGGPGQPNYAAAKMGIVGFTYSCANSLDRYGVTVNAIAPVADTRMNENIVRPPRAADDQRNPEQVATVVAYLASVASSWCTGRVIGVAGTQVSLYSDPQVIRQLTSAEPWDIGKLGSLMEKSFSPVPRNSAGRYDYLKNRKPPTESNSPDPAAPVPKES